MILSTAVNTAGDAVLIAVLGWIVVFLGLVALLLVVAAIGIFFKKKNDKKLAEPTVAIEEIPQEDAPLAPGSAGQLKLHDVDPKTAAMVMAIVAHKLQMPLNELRFISIKEVK